MKRVKERNNGNTINGQNDKHNLIQDDKRGVEVYVCIVCIRCAEAWRRFLYTSMFPTAFLRRFKRPRPGTQGTGGT